MRNAERGASQIPLVICIVLLLVAGIFAYTQYSAASDFEGRLHNIQAAGQGASDVGAPSDEQLIKYIREDRSQLADMKTRLEEILKKTGGADEEKADLVVSPTKLGNTVQKLLDNLDKGTYVVEFPVDRYIDDPAGGIKVSSSDSKVVVNYISPKDLRGLSPDMTNVIDYVVTAAMNRMVNDIKRYRDAYSNAVTAKDTAEASYKSDLAGKDAQIKQKNEDMANAEGASAQKIADLRQENSQAQAAKAAADKEKDTAVAALTAERNRYRSEAEKNAAAVQVLKARKREVEKDTSPDGQVLSVSDKQDFVVIDLGKGNNNLLAGTNFDVYAIGKNGMEIPKGTIKVAKVDPTSSECRVLDVFDAYNPIAPGDKIRSYFYSPRETIHVAMVGRFQKMGKSDAARRLQSLGVVVDDKVTIQTTYLIVGGPEAENQPIEETPEYKSAEMYGIPHITEKELSKFTMY